MDGHPKVHPDHAHDRDRTSHVQAQQPLVGGANAPCGKVNACAHQIPLSESLCEGPDLRGPPEAATRLDTSRIHAGRSASDAYRPSDKRVGLAAIFVPSAMARHTTRSRAIVWSKLQDGDAPMWNKQDNLTGTLAILGALVGAAACLSGSGGDDKDTGFETGYVPWYDSGIGSRDSGGSGSGSGDGGSGSSGSGSGSGSDATGGGSSGSDGGSSGGDSSGEGDGTDTDDGGSDGGGGSGGGRTFSSSFGMMERLTNETYQAGASCLQSSFMSSNTPADCSFCDFAFEYTLSESGGTDCSSNPWSGETIGFGVGDYYGADYVVYDYYGDWMPAFPAYARTGDYAYFYRYDDYDYPYEYNGTTYYITSVWSGYMFAYE